MSLLLHNFLFLFVLACGLDNTHRGQATWAEDEKPRLMDVEALLKNQGPAGVTAALMKFNQKQSRLDSAKYVEIMTEPLMATALLSNTTPELKEIVATIAVKVLERAEKEVDPKLVIKQGVFLSLVFQNLSGRSQGLPMHMDGVAAGRLIKAMLNRLSQVHAAAEKLADYDVNHPNIKISLYEPPASYKGPFIFGMDPQVATDPVVQKDYADFLQRRNNFIILSVKRNELVQAEEKFKAGVVTFLKHMVKQSGDGGLTRMKQIIHKDMKDQAAADALIDAVEQAVRADSRDNSGG